MNISGNVWPLTSAFWYHLIFSVFFFFQWKTSRTSLRTCVRRSSASTSWCVRAARPAWCRSGSTTSSWASCRAAASQRRAPTRRRPPRLQRRTGSRPPPPDSASPSSTPLPQAAPLGGASGRRRGSGSSSRSTQVNKLNRGFRKRRGVGLLLTDICFCVDVCRARLSVEQEVRESQQPATQTETPGDPQDPALGPAGSVFW